MANSRGPSTMRNMMYNGKHSLLPPKSPFPSIAPSYSDYISSAAIGPKGTPNYRDGNPHHQRASSESLLVEEQPSWLDELLNEPETPVQRGHRRSSSDSFTYLEAANAANTKHAVKHEHWMRNLSSAPSWASQDFDFYKDAQNMPFYAEPNPMINNKTRTWDSPQNAHSTGTASSRHNFGLRRTVSLGASQELNGIASTTNEKQEAAEAGPQDSAETGPQDINASERKDSSNTKAFASETDTKRAKQQFAQRSRVRKLQYIAELERNVQALQAEGSEVSAELEFLNQQSLILSMENKALKQRLDNLAQEQLIKRYRPQRRRPGGDNRIKDERGNRREQDNRSNGGERFDRDENPQSMESEDGRNPDDPMFDNFGGQGLPFPSEIPPPPVLMPVPGAGPLGPFVPAPPEVAMRMLRDQGGPSPFEGGGRNGSQMGGGAPIIALPPSFRQDPRRLRSYQDLDAPEDEVTVIDYRSL